MHQGFNLSFIITLLDTSPHVLTVNPTVETDTHEITKILTLHFSTEWLSQTFQWREKQRAKCNNGQPSDIKDGC
jgi:hypothetical protein